MRELRKHAEGAALAGAGSGAFVSLNVCKVDAYAPAPIFIGAV
jgi:hypothetical protein